MKKVLYTMPAVMMLIFYGMLVLLAGGSASLQPRAWMMILMPVLSAALLLWGKWWGAIPGVLLGGMVIGIGMQDWDTVILVFGAVFVVYYLAMGILCRKEARKNP